jgi:hypothetical protein
MYAHVDQEASAAQAHPPCAGAAPRSSETKGKT